MRRVLVTDAEQRSALAVVRSLGRAGYHVEVCSAAPHPLAGASRFARGEHRVTDPSVDSVAFVDDLAGLVDRASIDVLIPMTDVSASIALSLRETRPNLVIPFPARGTWEDVSDKAHLMDVAREVGVPVPREIAVDDPTTGCGEALRFASEVGWPVVLKPHRSAVTGLSGIEKFGVRIVTDEPSLVDGLARYPADAFPVLVQERIQGPGLGAFFLAIRGEVIASFAHRRIREKPPTGGVSVVRDSVPLRDDVGRYSEALLGRFGWSGVAMVEFKEDAATGIPYLMEINGRFWGSLQLAIDAGVDFPTLLLGYFDEGGASPSAGSFRSGVRSRWFWGDVDHLLWILRAPSGYRETNPELPGRMSAILRFLLPWRPGLKYEVLRLSDLRPFLRESRQWIAQVTSPG